MVKHLGDITKIRGFSLPPVDCITGGSPCQDLSVAGKRAGLAGERSGLFMEQIRIIKEMRDASKLLRGEIGADIHPRYMVWENVAGAFSSNKGQDFAAVLEETIKIIECNPPHVPVPKKGWSKSGCLYNELGKWSIAWRVHDAQFWGVPQRRVRIALVADFGGLTAPEVLFVREGLSWHPVESESEREAVTDEISDGTNKTSTAADINTFDIGEQRINALAMSFHLTQDPVSSIEKTPCLSTGSTHGRAVIGVYDARGNGDGKTVCTLTGDHQNRVTDYTALVCGLQGNGIESSDTAVACYSNETYNTWTKNESGATLRASGGIYGGGSETLVKSSVVRRLTPLECERLQGYPDGWTDIGEWTNRKGQTKQTTDSNRYKALGNSIALPFWFWLLRRISAQYERRATLGSLFDGIGGFPLCWERCNGKGTAVWASEIEDFCIAVTKKHFGDGENEEPLSAGC